MLSVIISNIYIPLYSWDGGVQNITVHATVGRIRRPFTGSRVAFGSFRSLPAYYYCDTPTPDRTTGGVYIYSVSHSL
jgi:hypothetical protein